MTTIFLLFDVCLSRREKVDMMMYDQLLNTPSNEFRLLQFLEGDDEDNSGLLLPAQDILLADHMNIASGKQHIECFLIHDPFLLLWNLKNLGLWAEKWQMKFNAGKMRVNNYNNNKFSLFHNSHVAETPQTTSVMIYIASVHRKRFV